eukprot:UN25435
MAESKIRVLLVGGCNHSCCIPNPNRLNSELIVATFIKNNLGMLTDEKQMEKYDCVVFGCHRTKNTGDNLAKVVDNGKPVILCNHTVATNWNSTPQGKFSSDKYLPLFPLQNTGGNLTKIKVEDTEFADDFKEFVDKFNNGNRGNAAVFWKNSHVKAQDGVVHALTGTATQGEGCPIVAIRTDKNAMVMAMNLRVSDSYSSTYPLLQKCIEISCHFSKSSAEFIKEQVAVFEEAKKKAKFGDCVDVVKKLQRALHSNERKLKCAAQQVEEAKKVKEKAETKRKDLQARLGKDEETLKKLTEQLKGLRVDSEVNYITWNSKDVCDWLVSLDPKFAKYKEAITKNEVTGEFLASLDAMELSIIGIKRS